MIETCAALGKIQGVQTGYDEAVDGLISNIRAQL